MTKIDPNNSAHMNSGLSRTKDDPAAPKGPSFGDVLSGVADAALATTSAVAPMLPGGQAIGAAAQGIQALKGSSQGLGGANGDQIDRMWQMQQENQAYNMEYMQLQQSMQADNRNFSTMSNLLKVRHDTAKSAINNMHA